VLREGHPHPMSAQLEAGLLRLARTGYFKPIRKEDIRVQLDEATPYRQGPRSTSERLANRARVIGWRHGPVSAARWASSTTVFDLLKSRGASFRANSMAARRLCR